ncbi:MAG: phenylacetate--CoA ligase family protein [Longimicrobiaceae bacterium]
MLDPIDVLSPALLRAEQEVRWAEALPHLLRTPFYRRRLASAGVAPGTIGSLAGLRYVPFTHKAELRAAAPLERTPHGLGEIESFFTSSGTSGEPTAYAWTAADTAVLREGGARAMRRIGVRTDDLALLVAPMGLPVMWYCMLQQFHAAGVGVVPVGVRPPDELLNALAAFPVSIVVTLPVVATRLFEFLQLRGSAEAERPRLRQVQCGGDFLSEARRARIEACWGAECVNLFGISELFGPIAGECEARAGMHLLADCVYCEVVDPATGEAVPDGETGVAVYTTLWSKGAPLLRYWSDDFVRLETTPCACGRASPRLHFEGRGADMLPLPERRVFAKRLEERVLVSPNVGSEYRLELMDGAHRPSARLVVEETPFGAPPIHELGDAVGDYIGMRPSIVALPPGSLPRDVPKPRRLVDLRTGATSTTLSTEAP